MYSLLAIPFLFLFISSISGKPLLESNDELIFVHALWRHGDRAPNFAWPTDPNQENAWPQGWGSLSSLGMHQHMRLGRKLRDHLKDFVSRHYVAKEVYIRSSDVNRTLASATSNMIGFFDKEQKQDGKDFPRDATWPLGFVPIPVHTTSIETDYLKSMPNTCPKIKAIKKLLKKTPEYKKLEKDNKELLKTFSDLTGIEVKLKDVFHIHDTLFIEKQNNKSFSPGITDELYEKLGELTQKFLNLKYGIGLHPYKGVDFGVELPRLNGGWVLGEIIDRMLEKRKCLETVNKKSNTVDDECNWINGLKYFVYSGHEESLASSLRTLGFNHTNYKSDGMPTYASCLTFELWNNNSKGYFVKVNYLLHSQEAIDITNEIVGCERGCTLNEFEKRSMKYRMFPNADAICAEEE